jgi:microcin C transport system permease protein
VTSYFIRRTLLIIPTFVGITLAAFVVMHFVPGGPIEQQIMRYKMAMMQEGGGGSSVGQFGTEIPPEALEEMKKFYGFDKPVHIRYINWLWNILHLDLGRSYTYQDPVWDVIKSRFPISIFLV